MKTVISVDWDFFVFEDPAWDIQHRESIVYIQHLWAYRYHLIDRMKTNGNEIGFWEGLKKQFGAAKLRHIPIYVSESHSFAISVCQLHKPEMVISFDTHHDLWPLDGQKDSVFCHNWLRAYLKGSKRSKAIWVYPKHSIGLFKMPSDKIAQRCLRRPDPYRFKADEIEIEAIHICRSGAWTPPWLDKQFVGFVSEAELLTRFSPYVDEARIETFENGVRTPGKDIVVNPMQPRWSDKDLKQAKVIHEAIQKQHQTLCKIEKIGNILKPKGK